MSDNNLNGRFCQMVDELVGKGLTLTQARKAFERQFILASLARNDGSIGRSAKSLGVHRNTLRNKVSALNIQAEDFAAARAKASGP